MPEPTAPSYNPTSPSTPISAVPPLQPFSAPLPPPAPPLVAPLAPQQPPPPTSYPPAVPNSGSNKIKIALIIGAVLVLIGGALAIFKPSLPFFGGGTQPITISYWGLWEQAATIKPLIDQYQSTHPGVTINYEMRSPTQYRETLLSRLAEGSGPDIFRFHNTWYPMMSGELSPVPDSTYTSAEMSATFYPVVTADLSVGGKYYGIPLMIDDLALVYNDDLLKAAGFTTPPATWTDVRQTYVPKLTTYKADGTINISGIALGTAGNVDNWSDILGLLMLQNGTKMIDQGTVSFNKSTGVDALDFYTLFAKKDFSTKGPAWSSTLPSSVEAFATGKVAMIIIPSYRVFDVLTLIAQSGKTFTMKVATVPQTQAVGQQPAVNWASYWVEGVAKRSKNQAAAWDFLKFLSSKDSERQLYTEQSKSRPFGELPSRMDLADALSTNLVVAPYLEAAKTAKSWYLAGNTSDNGLNDQMITYFSDAVNSVLTKSVTSSDALATAAKGASQVLGRYGLVQTSGAAAASQ